MLSLIDFKYRRLLLKPRPDIRGATTGTGLYFI